VADWLFLQFNTLAGHVLDRFPANQVLRLTKRRVIREVNLETVTQADDFVVSLDGHILDETKTLSSLGIRDLSVLSIKRPDVTMI
jgi:hypothetical protein